VTVISSKYTQVLMAILRGLEWFVNGS
jgi:hypothetical protein